MNIQKIKDRKQIGFVNKGSGAEKRQEDKNEETLGEKRIWALGSSKSTNTIKERY